MKWFRVINGCLLAINGIDVVVDVLKLKKWLHCLLFVVRYMSTQNMGSPLSSFVLNGWVYDFRKMINVDSLVGWVIVLLVGCVECGFSFLPLSWINLKLCVPLPAMKVECGFLCFLFLLFLLLLLSLSLRKWISIHFRTRQTLLIYLIVNKKCSLVT